MRTRPSRSPAHDAPSAARRRLSRRALFSGASLLGLGTLTACAGREADASARKAENVLSISLNQTQSHPSYTALNRFGELLAEATGNRWGARVYPNENLGAQQEMLQLMADGSVDMGVVSATQIENLSQRFRPLNLPGAFRDIEHQLTVLKDEELIGDLFTSLSDSHNLRVLGGLSQGSRHLYTRRSGIRLPKDLAGQKIRVQESAVFLDLIRAMGGSPAPMAYGEVYTALQAGVLDGAENNEVSYVTQRHYEVAGTFTLTNHLVGLDYVLVGERTFQRMGERDRNAFQEAFRQAQDEFVTLWKQETEDALETMRSNGVSIETPDRAAFEKVVVRVADRFLDNPRDRELYEAARAVGGGGSS